MVSCQHAIRRGIHHILTIVTHEHPVSDDIRADLQLQKRILLVRVGYQCGTVATHIDGTTDHRSIIRLSCHTDRHLLGIRTESVQGIDGGRTLIIVIVSPNDVISKIRIIGIGIRAVTTAIDITSDIGIDTYGITEIHLTGDIVATIDIVDITTADKDTGGKIIREVITGEVVHRCGKCRTVLRGEYVCLSATTIDILRRDRGSFRNLQQQTFGTRHASLITTTVEVDNGTAVKMPGRCNAHICLVITTEDTKELISWLIG